MARRLSQILDQWRLRKVQDHWSRVADTSGAMDPFALRALRAEAWAMRRQIDRVLHVADHRLAVSAPGAGLPRAPLGTDWAWRPDVWRGPIPTPGAVAKDARTAISNDLAAYHDCPLGEVVLRQIRNTAEPDRAPFGLTLDVFGFRGSFLSLAVSLPEAAVSGLKARHLIRVDALIDCDRPVRGFVRLNIKHGPNIEQMVSALAPDGREKLVEFDLAYAGIDEARVERAWLDLILNDAAMTRITLRDLAVSRRPRAEI
ncbi:DUF6478 family protein [Tabrizicola sp.]|uniref:DUF6478 family protein n=1 Tax=Tabrizicola sp. TaxID=2005166 RepID=UPI002631B773|nr:DUF6478 family protein [Tabrizicola sp.]MDM7932611.1 DUF6478 family protein [Tabrizicola sp.]